MYFFLDVLFHRREVKKGFVYEDRGVVDKEIIDLLRYLLFGSAPYPGRFSAPPVATGPGETYG